MADLRGGEVEVAAICNPPTQLITNYFVYYDEAVATSKENSYYKPHVLSLIHPLGCMKIIVIVHPNCKYGKAL